MTTDARALTPEQKEQFRQRVLRGERLDNETARLVVESLRGERMNAKAAAAASGKSKSSRKKGMTDEQLDADLDSILASVAAGTGTSGAGDAGKDSAPDLDIS